MTDLTSIFYEIDNFCKEFEKQIKMVTRTRNRKFALRMSEIITISIWYHYSGYKTFKDYYIKHVQAYLQNEFPKLVSYNRFIELRKLIIMPLLIMLYTRKLSPCMGISFIDSFKLEACHIKRASSHKTLKLIASKGKTSMGWFYGLKVHICINYNGEIIAFCITPGNIADNNEEVLVKITKDILGKLFGDKGYIVNSKLFEQLYNNGIQMITKIRSNMKNKLMELENKLLLSKRGVIESAIDILKEHLNIEHSRHRSIWGFFVHTFSSLISYQMREAKPKLPQELAAQFLLA